MVEMRVRKEQVDVSGMGCTVEPIKTQWAQPRAGVTDDELLIHLKLD